MRDKDGPSNMRGSRLSLNEALFHGPPLMASQVPLLLPPPNLTTKEWKKLQVIDRCVIVKSIQRYSSTEAPEEVGQERQSTTTTARDAHATTSRAQYRQSAHAESDAVASGGDGVIRRTTATALAAHGESGVGASLQFAYELVGGWRSGAEEGVESASA